MVFPSRLRGKRRGLPVAIFLVAVVLLADAFVIEPASLVVREYQIALPDWPRALDGFRIAAVGDLHGGAPYVDRPKLEEVARRVSAAHPDLIVWLGDYVIQGVLGGVFMEPEEVAAILSKAQPRDRQIAILGNHDRWLDSERVQRAFFSAGITCLEWDSTTLMIKGIPLHVSGLGDFELSPNYWQHFGAAREDWLRVPSGEPILVLSHSPDIFPSIPARVALTLASHTHGGQVRLPLLGSPIVPSSYGQRFLRGPIVEGGRHLFVNTGIGTSIIPARFGVPPEISVVILHTAEPVGAPATRTGRPGPRAPSSSPE